MKELVYLVQSTAGLQRKTNILKEICLKLGPLVHPSDIWPGENKIYSYWSVLRQIGVRLSSSYKYINSIFGPPLLPMRQVLPWKTSYLMCNICQSRNKLLFSLPTNIYSLHNVFFPQAIFWPWNPNLKQLVDLKVLYSSPISQVMFSVFDTNVWEIFSQEMGFGL